MEKIARSSALLVAGGTLASAQRNKLSLSSRANSTRILARSLLVTVFRN